VNEALSSLVADTRTSLQVAPSSSVRKSLLPPGGAPACAARYQRPGWLPMPPTSREGKSGFGWKRRLQVRPWSTL
jgi:hypothetical protein